MAVKTKPQLTSTLNSNITDPLNKQNTASRVREIIQDIIDSMALGTGVLSNTLNSGKIFVGNGSNVATEQTLTLNASGGAFALSNTGILTMPNADASTRGLLTLTDWNTFNGKQDALISGTNIKTINGNSLLGSGNLVISGGWELNGSTVGSEKWLGTIDNYALPFRTNNVEVGRFTTSGNFGIGTNNPQQLGHFYKNFDGFSGIRISNLSVASNVYSGIQFENSAGTFEGFIGVTGVNNAFYGNGGSLYLGTSNATDILFITNNSTRSVLTSGGNLGLGITSGISARIHVQGSGATSATYITKFQNSSSTLMFQLRDDGLFTLGSGASVSGTGNYTSVAVGASSSAGAPAAIAIGFVASASAGIAIGIASNSDADDSISIGYYAGDSGTIAGGTVSIGAFSNASTTTGLYSTAVGYGAKTAGLRASAYGYLSTASAGKTAAIGYSCQATTGYSSAWGIYTKASGTEHSHVFGSGRVDAGGDNAFLENTVSRSMIFGIYSDTPTLRLTGGDGTAGSKGYVIGAAKDAALADADLNASEWTCYLNEAGNTLTFKVKYAGGTVKTGTIALV